MEREKLYSILAVDDEEAALNFISKLLKDKYRVWTIQDVDEALQLLKEQEIVVIMADQFMPKMSGTEFLSRAKEINPDIIRILFSGYSDLESVIDGVNKGEIFRYIVKPFTVDILVTVLKQAIEHYELVYNNKQFSEQLRIVNESLEEKVLERTKQIAEMNDELQMQNKIVLEANKYLRGAMEQIERTQHQLLQSEKMAGIGTLAAGVAHEINNPLGYINSNLGTLKDYISDVLGMLEKYGELESLIKEDAAAENLNEKVSEIEDYKADVDLDFIMEDFKKIVDESIEGSGRVREIVQNLKDFSHVDNAERKLADINKCIESTLKLVWNELKYKATVHKDLGSIPPADCYPMQLNQVFMNILVNASQAIPEKGEIFIKTHEDNGNIVIKIADTGTGIPKENLSKIFEPFFTTKDVGKGTGLGLSMAYGIIKKHNGTIEVESEVGKGTEFTVKIPIEMEEAEVAIAQNK